MIQLTRVRTVPPIHSNFFGAKRKQLNLELIKQKLKGELNEEGGNKWNSQIWKEAKEQLLIETHNKCAYCETPTSVVAYGDVEHFRPKSVYWWLAYCYENYLASCTICNQKYKKDKFELETPSKKLTGPSVTNSTTAAELIEVAAKLTPDPISDGEGMPFAQFEKDILGESALLLHPYHQNPAEFFAYEPILANKEVVVIPTNPNFNRMVKAAEDFYGINRQELMDLRFQAYIQYMTFRHVLSNQNLPANLLTACSNRLEEMRADFAAYAGMIRYFDTKDLSELPWDFNINLTGS
ncbi:HNH endonuclease family protein [Adhaeribacter soli]|uniref:TIGR02646 family protein n=1 Tax=Adhaeribacter soli TaxID=2607655 RepID=A0A5N1J2M3_9BACT|nr:hypothetical protein [Adhaeribacter soli]KAA9338783.1 hypothetical protein F0P94_08260 [Adhaeribacter soli]